MEATGFLLLRLPIAGVAVANPMPLQRKRFRGGLRRGGRRGLYGTAEGLAEKVLPEERNHPSAAKADSSRAGYGTSKLVP
jgi:hypothetical protein